MFIGFILAYIPYYFILRVVFFVFLMAPQTNGAAIIFKSLISPFLNKHEKEIQEFIKNVQNQADAAAAEGLKAANKAAQENLTAENLMKASAVANEAQSKLNEAAGGVDETKKAE